ncbi:cell division protein FtsQ/DivIB [Sphingomonas sp.]|uniref:cell division protein FtsQ/DivIB n=1 Tax=Sphingomonas sp. TaxID=28214 RepID=UPI00286E7DC2|nr:cell division protein FtsQ/DivIB [Sphingomonas sp.]
MSAAKVRRGGGGQRRPRKPAVAVPRKIAKRLPVDQARANRLAGVAFAFFLLAIAVVASIALDWPAKAVTAAGEAVGRAGFTVKRIDVQGIRQMDSAPVYEIALDQRSMAMPLVDVHAIRRKLLRFGWVKDARVSRRLPDTLVIDIVERTPTALWQDKQRLTLIDAEGVVLDKVAVDDMPDLPLLIGPGANARSQELARMLAAVPTLKPQLASASWVGRRRWDLSFQSGETVALPEGEVAAKNALMKFAKADRSSGLLGRGLVRFDLRVPGKMIVRLPRAPGEAIDPAAAAAEG